MSNPGCQLVEVDYGRIQASKIRSIDDHHRGL